MTKLEQKKFDEWAVGTVETNAGTNDIDYLPEEDLVVTDIMYELFFWQLQQDNCDEARILKLAAAMGIFNLV